MRLGFVGAGRMGLPMVRRLVGTGYEVRVLARSRQSFETLVADGASPVTAIEDVPVKAMAVLVCVFTDDQVREVCLDERLLDSMPAGSFLVVHTTASPSTLEAVASRAAEHGVDVVDAPVSGGPLEIEAGRLTVFAGSSAGAMARIRPVLSSYADPVLHVGPVGAGQKVKLVNNTLFAAQIGLLAEAARMGVRLGVDEAVLLDALTHGSVANRAIAGAAARGSVAAFTESVSEFVGKDVAVARQIAADLGADLGVLDDAINAV